MFFDDTRFQYKSPLRSQPVPVMCELPWPLLTHHDDWDSSQRRTPTPDLPLLDIQLQPRFDRRLQASIHNALLWEPVPAPITLLEPEPPNSTPAVSPPPPRQSSRLTKRPDRYGKLERVSVSTALDIKDEDVPKTWKQVLKSNHKDEWMKAAAEEFLSLIGMGTWKLVPQPQGRKIIKSKWVFKIKRKIDKSIAKLKGRLVAMGYTQVKGEDFDEIFSWTLRMETLRLIFTLLVNRNWVGCQADFKTAFLNGLLDEVIYMAQAPGFEDPNNPDWVYELYKSIYGLKQSPRQWNKELHAVLIKLCPKQSQYETTLYFKLSSNKLVGVITTHVDDLAVVGEQQFVEDVQTALPKLFPVSSDKELHHFLGIQITHNWSTRTV